MRLYEANGITAFPVWSVADGSLICETLSYLEERVDGHMFVFAFDGKDELKAEAEFRTLLADPEWRAKAISEAV